MNKVLLGALLALNAGLPPVGVAAAEAAGACPNAGVRAAQHSDFLGDCRAYELVSPADKSGGNVFWPNDLSLGSAVAGVTAASSDGRRLMYMSYQAFPGAQNAFIHSYRAERGEGGWSTADLTPPVTAAHPSFWNMGAILMDADEGLDLGITNTHNSYDALDQHADVPLTTEVYLRGADGAMAWVSRGDVSTPNTLSAASYGGHSADWKHIIFGSPKQLTPEAAGLVAGSLVYDRVGGRTMLVSIKDDGTLTSPCGAAVGSQGDLSFGDGGGGYRTAVSRDGRRVAFTSPDPAQVSLMPDPSCADPAQVYVRDGDQTVQASLSQRSSPDPASTQPAIYQGSSADGAKVFFTSSGALTDSAQPHADPSARFLYEYDVPSRVLKLLTPNNDDGSGPNVTGVVIVSDDGDRVYYVVANERLELYDGTAVRTVASGTGIGDQLVGNLPGNLAETARQARLSGDGSQLLFATVAKVTDFDNHGRREVYLYDLDEARIVCVSCNRDGHVPLGDADLKADAQGSSLKARNFLDGGLVLFETQDRLVGRDTNGVMDVYAWRDGSLQLISDGRTSTGSSGSYFIDASSDGHNVFFSTTSSLVGYDVDNGGTDIYVARIGGGFSEPELPRPQCDGDACQGAAAANPGTTVAGSITFAGSETPVDPPARRSVAKAPTVSKLKTVRGTSAALTVKVAARGTLKAAGPGLRSSTRNVARPGTVAMRVTLTSAARRTLARRRTLKVKARLTFKPSVGAAATVVVPITFKATAATKKGRS